MRSKHIVFVGWNRSVTGREADSIELFGEFTSYLNRLQHDGTIEGFESYTLEPHASDLNGCTIIYGDTDDLAKLRHSEEWQEFQTKGAYQLKGLRVLRGVCGDEVRNQMARLQKVIK